MLQKGTKPHTQQLILDFIFGYLKIELPETLGSFVKYYCQWDKYNKTFEVILYCFICFQPYYHGLHLVAMRHKADQSSKLQGCNNEWTETVQW